MAFTRSSSRTEMPGLGWALGIGALLGAAVGWVVTDMNKPDSTVRRWIEIGRRKVERRRFEREMAGDPEATVIRESIIEVTENRPQEPPEHQEPI